MEDRRSISQVLWGCALILAGIGVFFRIPQVMPKIETIETYYPMRYFIQFCFYLIGILLIGGGSRKVYYFYRPPGNKIKKV